MQKKFLFSLLFLAFTAFPTSSFAVEEICPDGTPCCTAPLAIKDGGGCPTGEYWIGDVLTGSCQSPTACTIGQQFLCRNNTCVTSGNSCATSLVDTGFNSACCLLGEVPVSDGVGGWSCGSGGGGGSDWTANGYGISYQSGNVGIGTSAPAAELQVTGGSEASLNNGTGYFLIGDEGAGNIVMDEGEIQARYNGAAGILYLQPEGGRTNIGSGTLAVWENGQVAIGNIEPDAAFHVAGEACFSDDGNCPINVGVGDVYVKDEFLVGSATSCSLSGTPSQTLFQNDPTRWTAASFFDASATLSCTVPHTAIYANGGDYPGIYATCAQGSSTCTSGVFYGGNETSDTTANSGYLIVGNPSTYHLSFDTNEIQAKNSSTTATSLYLNPDGNGNVYVNMAHNSSATGLCHTGELMAYCSSLRELKKNIKDLGLGLETVMKLHPVSFDWKDESVITGKRGADGNEDLGFIAEEVEAVDPLMAEYAGEKLQGVKYKQLTAVLTKAVQEQQVQIEALKALACADHPEAQICQ